MKSMTLYDPEFPAFRVAGSLFGNGNPFEALDRLLAQDDFFPAGFRAPVVDVSEDDKRYLIEAELPGLSDKDLKLEVKDGVLEISAERKDRKEEKDGTKWIRRERREFSFMRRFSLPDEVDAEKIEAAFKDGVLSVELPKKPQAAPRSVPVKAA